VVRMGKTIYRISIENSIYFSIASFVIIWIAGLLYTVLEKTPGRISLGALILIVLSLILILFLLALTNIILGVEDVETNFFMRLTAVFLFALLSTIILLALLAFFWYPIY
jgi:hypothetical protein